MQNWCSIAQFGKEGSKVFECCKLDRTLDLRSPGDMSCPEKEQMFGRTEIWSMKIASVSLTGDRVRGELLFARVSLQETANEIVSDGGAGPSVDATEHEKTLGQVIHHNARWIKSLNVNKHWSLDHPLQSRLSLSPLLLLWPLFRQSVDTITPESLACTSLANVFTA